MRKYGKNIRFKKNFYSNIYMIIDIEDIIMNGIAVGALLFVIYFLE